MHTGQVQHPPGSRAAAATAIAQIGWQRAQSSQLTLVCAAMRHEYWGWAALCAAWRRPCCLLLLRCELLRQQSCCHCNTAAKRLAGGLLLPCELERYSAPLQRSAACKALMP